MADKKTIEALEKQNTKLKEALELQKENIKVIAEEYGLREDIQKVIVGADKQSKSQLEVTKDIIDKTKDVLDNSKKITEETLSTVNLHQLERKAIAEGLQDRVEIIQKMKSIQEIQKETNRVVNVQANAFKSIGDSIDGMIKTIPGIGGVLADALGTSEMGTELSEQFRTAFAEAFDAGGVADNIQQGMVEGATSGFVENSLTNTSKKGFMQGIPLSLKSAGVLAALVGATKFGFSGGAESLGFRNRFRKVIFGSTFDAFKDAFGNLNNASFVSLFRSKVLGVRFGVEQTDVAKILRAQTEISGLTQGQALNVQNSIAALASRQGVLAKDVFADIASNTEIFAKFAKDGGQNIGLAAVQARKLGLSLDTVGTIAESVLDFQSSIEGELKASLLIGRQLNLNRARELALAGDLAGLQQEIVSLVGSEQELNRLNIIQRKSLAQALGITVEQLGKLAGGEVELKSSEMKQNTDMMGFLARALIAATAAQGIRTLAPLGTSLAGKITPTLGRITAAGTLDKRFAVNQKLLSQGVKVQGGKIVAGLAGRRALGAIAGVAFGPIGIALTTIVGFMPLIASGIRKLTGSNEDIANNTKKSVSQELNFPIFTSETLAENKS